MVQDCWRDYIAVIFQQEFFNGLGSELLFYWRASEASETLSGLFNRELGIYILEKWFPLQGERAHSLKLFCMYDKRFEISKTK